MGWWTLAHTHTHAHRQDVTPKTKCCNGTRCHRMGKLERKKHKGKMSQYGKEAARNRLEICLRWTKCHKPVKKRVDMMSQVTWCPSCDMRGHKIPGCCERSRIVTGRKCHSGLNIQWMFLLGQNVQWTFRWWTFRPGTPDWPATHWLWSASCLPAPESHLVLLTV